MNGCSYCLKEKLITNKILVATQRTISLSNIFITSIEFLNNQLELHIFSLERII